MEAVASLFTTLPCDLVGLHWLLDHRPEQVRCFDERAAQIGCGNDIYFAGDHRAPGVEEALRELPSGASIHAPVSWLGTVSDAWSGKVSRLNCSEWRLAAGATPPTSPTASPKVLALSAPLLPKLAETGMERLIQPYSSAEEFLDLSFGYAIVQQNKIVSACTAFYIAAATADLATETYPSLRNNGFGTAVLQAGLIEAVRRGLQPQVHASACNAPIARIVEKLGFEPALPYELYARMA
jgi:GNAT superfamily N-acetyltransferase